MCRGKVTARSEDDVIQDVFSLFEQLEEKGFLGLDRLEIMKGMLKGVKEWALFGEVKKFQRKRKEYLDLLEQIVRVLDEFNDLERLIRMCRGKMPEANEANVHDVRSLFKVLQDHNCLGIDCLGILKEILTQTEQNDLLKEVEEFEERIIREDEFASRKAQASALMSSIGNKLIGVLNIKTVFKVVAGGITAASTLEILSRGSTYDQLVNGINRCVLPAGTSLLQISEGCVCLTVQAKNLSALNTLWSLYQEGTLKERLQTFYVTDELRELAGGEEVEVIVAIEEQEYKKACVELTRKAQDADNREERRPTGMHRRNSDSNLYCKARDGEVPKERTIQPENAVLNQTKYLDQERLAFVQRYLEKAEDARSVTTETSDSGMQGTHGAPSELGIDEASDSTYKLCFKDLSDDMVQKLANSFEADPISLEWFHHTFGLDREKTLRYPKELSDVFKLFPDTPIKLLKDVCEALQLHDVVELLEKAKPRTLRPAFPMKEIEKLPHVGKRPTTFYSKVAALIIDSGTSHTINVAKKIGSFFEALNSQNAVITITAGPLIKLLEELRQLKYTETERERLDDDIEWVEKELQELAEMEKLSNVGAWMSTAVPPAWDKSSRLKRKLEELRKSKEQWTKEKKAKIEKVINQKEDELQKEEEKFQRAVSTVIDQWVHNEDKKSTLFAVFENCRTDDVIAEHLTKGLALIPGDAKLVITPSREKYERIGEIPETLHVEVNSLMSGHHWLDEEFVVTMLEVLSKRWQTMDLISTMQEVQRRFARQRMPDIGFFGGDSWDLCKYWTKTCKINDSLSSLPRLQKTDQTSLSGP